MLPAEPVDRLGGTTGILVGDLQGPVGDAQPAQVSDVLPDRQGPVDVRDLGQLLALALGALAMRDDRLEVVDARG